MIMASIRDIVLSRAPINSHEYTFIPHRPHPLPTPAALQARPRARARARLYIIIFFSSRAVYIQIAAVIIYYALLLLYPVHGVFRLKRRRFAFASSHIRYSGGKRIFRHPAVAAAAAACIRETRRLGETKSVYNRTPAICSRKMRPERRRARVLVWYIV